MSQTNTSIKLTWKNSTSDYYYVVVNTVEANPVPIISNTGSTSVTIPTRQFQSEPQQYDNTTIQSQSFQYFGVYRVVLFHLNPDYAALYKQNSTSTQNISTPPSSITNGLGLFTGINTDTLYVTVKEQ
ncbi:hypothetical protein [Spirosoma telluris]|uniref:hypothetical protein n=1 Tax=Spirosoma telluris TaxID=2183553 RepID=UPI002FC2DF03